MRTLLHKPTSTRLDFVLIATMSLEPSEKVRCGERRMMKAEVQDEWPQYELYRKGDGESQVITLPEVYEWTFKESDPEFNELNLRRVIAAELCDELAMWAPEATVVIIVHKDEERFVQALFGWADLLRALLGERAMTNAVLIAAAGWAPRNELVREGLRDGSVVPFEQIQGAMADPNVSPEKNVEGVP